MEKIVEMLNMNSEDEEFDPRLTLNEREVLTELPE
jgi:hypothetical protein